MVIMLEGWMLYMVEYILAFLDHIMCTTRELGHLSSIAWLS